MLAIQISQRDRISPNRLEISMSPPKPDPPWDEPLSDRITFGLSRLATALKLNAWRESTPLQLTPTQAEILALLRAWPAATLKEVAARLEVRPATASDAVRVLVEKGWVTKSKRPDDARVLSLDLSEEGRALADQVAGWPRFLTEVIDTLPEEEREVLFRAVTRLIRELQSRRQIEVARMCLTCRYFQPRRHPNDPENPHHCGLVDLPFGDLDLRLDCPEHQAAATTDSPLHISQR